MESLSTKLQFAISLADFRSVQPQFRRPVSKRPTSVGLSSGLILGEPSLLFRRLNLRRPVIPFLPEN